MPSPPLKPGHAAHGPLPLLVLTEGKHDIEFLRRMSRMLHAADPHVVELADLEQAGRLVFLPCGGGDFVAWADRLLPLGCRQFYLFDRDGRSVAEAERQAAAIVRERPGCRALATGKRSLENYLHPRAIWEARGITVEISDDSDVADSVARACYEQVTQSVPWDVLPLRARKRQRNHVKKWLNTRAVDHMTPGRLDERDPQGEVRLWLTHIAELLPV